jgi:iron(III) transport system ATP-binding protein
MLSLHGVTRRFGPVTALDGVSLEIARGQVVCLVGHSGCGKSTLLRAIAGIETIDSGLIAIEGQTVTGPDVFVEPEHRRVGFMFQDYALFPHLTVRQNIGFGLTRMARPERESRIEEIIARIGIKALEDRHPHMLSGGEQQRVALARALAPQPRVLLMDEPFSNLDRGLREQVRRETLSIVRGLGITAVVVTHDPEEALAIGDLVALMQNGRLVEMGAGDDIFMRPKSSYAAGFFSQVNDIPARVSGDDIETPLGRFPAIAGMGHTPRVLVRPQSINLGPDGIHARVVSRTILGEIEELVLAIEAMDQPLVMRSTDRHGVRAGDEVFLTINNHEVLVFSE